MAPESTAGTVRRATWGERKELLDAIGIAFARPGDKPKDFSEMYPHLFTEARIGNHFVFAENGRILGAVGLYPFDMRYEGVVFRTAGIGQVATLPDARGRGVMQAIMREVCRSIHDDGMDFAWLGGDRLRYGRFGFARGGVKIRFDFWDRYLPPPPPEDAVRRFDKDSDFGLVRESLDRAPCAAVMPDAELRLWLAPNRGWVMNGSFIYCDGSGETVLVADGDEDEIALLMAHQARHLRKASPEKGRISAEAGVQPTALLRACQRRYGGYTMVPPASFRVGPLVPFLEKACRAAASAIGKGSARLELVNSDTGEAATIACRGGKAAVSRKAGAKAFRFTTTELSEIFFGPVAMDLLLPSLPKDSPIRRIFPMPVFRSAFFAL